MPIELGRIEAIYRYPVKSMRGEPLDDVALGWHGVDGDRRLALRRVGDRGGFPWLTGGRLPDLLRYTPCRPDGGEGLPTHVRTPEGATLDLFGEALAADVGRRHGAAVEVMRLDHGVFDEGTVSVLTSHTAGEICRLGGVPADLRRFRANVVVRSILGVPFEEDGWLGGVLTFGSGEDAPAVVVTQRDVRCSMVTFDPGGPGVSPEVLKAVVRANDNHAGIYASVTRVGRLRVGQTVVLHR